MVLDVGQFEIILTILFVVGSGFATWLYRHERWFRDRVFPVLQILTGTTPSGEDVPADPGHLEETQNRFEKVESDTQEAKEVAKEALQVAKETNENVEEVAEKQERYHQQNESILRTILNHVDDVDDEDIDRPLFRGGSRGGDTDPTPDGGEPVGEEPGRVLGRVALDELRARGPDGKHYVVRVEAGVRPVPHFHRNAENHSASTSAMSRSS